MRTLVNFPLFCFIFVIALVGIPVLLRLPEMPFSFWGAGLFTGWLGCGALAASLLLMVREPAVASCLGGLGRMYRWHHFLGVLGYGLLLSHPILLAGQSLAADPSAAWRLLAPWPQTAAVLLGWGGLLGLMLGLGATFATRLRYSVWRTTHVLLSVGVLLGLGHVFLIGGGSVAFWVATVPILGAFLWRVLRVDRSVGGRPYEVSSATCLSPDVVEVSLRPLTRALSAAPGQFVMAAFFEGPHFQGCGEYHPYTVSGGTSQGGLILTIKALGDCTRTLQSLEPGVAARIEGPFGEFFAQRRATPELWIAGGIGITPFLAQLRLGEVTQPTEFIYAYRAAQDACYLNEVAHYAETHPLLHFQPLLSQNDLAPLFAVLTKVSDLPARQAFLCGPRPFVAAITAWLTQHGMPEQSIHFEKFEFRS